MSSGVVTTVTIPTPVHPIPTYLCHSRVIRITPEHPMPLPNPLAPSQVNSRLSNALPNTLTPLCLVDASPTQHSFDLSLSSCQVDSRHPHSFPTQCHSTFSLLAVGQSLITYLPRSMHPSLSFLALFISVSLLSTVRSSVTSFATLHSFSMSHPQFPVSVYPRFIYLYSLPPLTLL